jgi:hypothetical protein
MQPELAALWEKRMRRYQGFEHLQPKLLSAQKKTNVVAAGLGLSPVESCGFELFNNTAPITTFSGMWAVPHLNHSQNGGLPNLFRTFFGLGFLDLHVEMSVDSSQAITAVVRIHTGAEVALAVSPGDVINATLCLQTNSAGTGFYGLVNETTAQTMNFTIDTGFPPAVAFNAGVSRGSHFNGPPDPLARFGTVYFDELVAYSANGTRLLTNGTPTTMTSLNGSTTLAIPQRISDFAFKAIFRAS